MSCPKLFFVGFDGRPAFVFSATGTSMVLLNRFAAFRTGGNIGWIDFLMGAPFVAS